MTAANGQTPTARGVDAVATIRLLLERPELLVPSSALIDVKDVGVGGFAQVMLAFYSDGSGQRRKVAVKRFHTHVLQDDSLLSLIANEVKIAGKVDNRFACKLIGIGAEDPRSEESIRSTFYMVLEYVPGASLKALLRVLAGNYIAFGVKATHLVTWAQQLATALAYLHDFRPAILHRDIKLDNVLLTEPMHGHGFGSLGGAEVRLIDFGLARHLPNLAASTSAVQLRMSQAVAPCHRSGQEVEWNSRLRPVSSHPSLRSLVDTVVDSVHNKTAEGGSFRKVLFSVRRQSKRGEELLDQNDTKRSDGGGSGNAPQDPLRRTLVPEPPRSELVPVQSGDGGGGLAALTQSQRGSRLAAGKSVPLLAIDENAGGAESAVRRCAAKDGDGAAAPLLNGTEATPDGQQPQPQIVRPSPFADLGRFELVCMHSSDVLPPPAAGTGAAAPHPSSSLGQRRPPGAAAAAALSPSTYEHAEHASGPDLMPPAAAAAPAGAHSALTATSDHRVAKAARQMYPMASAAGRPTHRGDGGDGVDEGGEGGCVDGSGGRGGSDGKGIDGRGDGGGIDGGGGGGGSGLLAPLPAGCTPLSASAPAGALQLPGSSFVSVFAEGDTSRRVASELAEDRDDDDGVDDAFLLVLSMLRSKQSHTLTPGGSLHRLAPLVPSNDGTHASNAARGAASLHRLSHLAPPNDGTPANAAVRDSAALHSGREEHAKLAMLLPRPGGAVVAGEGDSGGGGCSAAHAEIHTGEGSQHMSCGGSTAGPPVPRPLLIANGSEAHATRPSEAASLQHQLTGRTGSLLYMAPEVFKGEPYNEKADVFSFGMCLFELLSRKLIISTVLENLAAQQPRGTSFEEKEEAILEYAQAVAAGYRPPLSADLPEALSELLRRCWSKNPLERPSMHHIVASLGEVLRSPALLAPLDQDPHACACCIVS